MPSHVGGHEGGPRISTNEIVPLPHELLESRMLVRTDIPVRKERELQPALVAVVVRLIELLRITGVNEHRKPEPGGGRPDRIEIGIVEREPRSVRFADRLPERLADLADPHRSRGGIGVELRYGALGPARTDSVEVDSGQDAYAVLHLW